MTTVCAPSVEVSGGDPGPQTGGQSVYPQGLLSYQSTPLPCKGSQTDSDWQIDFLPRDILDTTPFVVWLLEDAEHGAGPVELCPSC